MQALALTCWERERMPAVAIRASTLRAQPWHVRCLAAESRKSILFYKFFCDSMSHTWTRALALVGTGKQASKHSRMHMRAPELYHTFIFFSKLCNGGIIYDLFLFILFFLMEPKF